MLALAGCTQPQAQSPTVVPAQGKGTVSVTLAINDGASARNFSGEFAKGTTALEVFRRFANLTTKDYGSAGAYIVAVNGIAENQGGNGRFWQYYVDGEYGKVGASAFKIGRDLSLELRLEKPNPAAYR